MRAFRLLWLFLVCTLVMPAHGLPVAGLVEAPVPQPGSINGVVTDASGAAVPGAVLSIQNDGAADRRTAVSDGTGAFALNGLPPSSNYHIAVTASGFADWQSPPITLLPGQALRLDDIRLVISVVETTVVAQTVEQLGRQQVDAEVKQRVLGVIPNFYVVYEKDAVPLTAKLKYRLGLRAATDTVNFAATFFLAAVNQAADAPDYQQGFKGYGQRVGSGYATSFADIMLGGAILPSLLHQDPRYFYQGPGSSGKSRALHAISAPFICKADKGGMQFNYSSIGGDLIASSLQNLYYPESNRGIGLVASGFLIDTGGRIANTLVQEFILQKYTTNAKKKP